MILCFLETYLIAAEAELNRAVADTSLVSNGCAPEEIGMFATADESALLFPLVESMELCIYQIVTFPQELIACVLGAASGLGHLDEPIGNRAQMQTIVLHTAGLNLSDVLGWGGECIHLGVVSCHNGKN